MEPLSRNKQLDLLQTNDLDILILGGGINGAGTLRDLALRNHTRSADLRLGLVEKNYFSSGTSGKNSHLIHGGLRYLKNMEFGLVREALHERATLLHIAPDLVWPQPFLLPFYSLWDQAQYTAGLTLYDLLARGADWTQPHCRLSREEALERTPGLNREHLRGGAVFFDCRVHSARLVLENLWEAANHGAAIADYVEAAKPHRDGDLWHVPLTDTLTGRQWITRARKIIDARGSWSDGAPLRLVRGSHIVVPQLTPGDTAISYFEPAGRIIFFLPWFGQTLVGTTDIDHPGGPDAVQISNTEITYLQQIVRTVFPDAPSAPPIAAFSSLRPLVRDAAASATKTSREHKIANDPCGILRISGGKYTTYRAMSEEAADLALAEIAPALREVHLTAATPIAGNTPEQLRTMLDTDPSSIAAQVEHAIRYEMVRHLADFLMTSTLRAYQQSWTQDQLAPLARQMAQLLGWDATATSGEIEKTMAALRTTG